MAGESKPVGKDETREFPKGKLEISTVGKTMIGRATFQPGWRWSESVKPIAGTDSCQVPHNGYVVSGRIHIKMDDNTIQLAASAAAAAGGRAIRLRGGATGSLHNLRTTRPISDAT